MSAPTLTLPRTGEGIYTAQSYDCGSATFWLLFLLTVNTPNVWINNLRNGLTVEQLELFANLADTDLPLDAYIYVVGEARGKKESVLTALRTRFHWVPEDIGAGGFC